MYSTHTSVEGEISEMGPSVCLSDGELFSDVVVPFIMSLYSGKVSRYQLIQCVC